MLNLLYSTLLPLNPNGPEVPASFRYNFAITTQAKKKKKSQLISINYNQSMHPLQTSIFVYFDSPLFHHLNVVEIHLLDQNNPTLIKTWKNKMLTLIILLQILNFLFLASNSKNPIRMFTIVNMMLRIF